VLSAPVEIYAPVPRANKEEDPVAPGSSTRSAEYSIRSRLTVSAGSQSTG
jgi:hypothetical protein